MKNSCPCSTSSYSCVVLPRGNNFQPFKLFLWNLPIYLFLAMWKFQGQGSNPNHSSDNTISLTARLPGNSYLFILKWYAYMANSWSFNLRHLSFDIYGEKYGSPLPTPFFFCSSHVPPQHTHLPSSIHSHILHLFFVNLILTIYLITSIKILPTDEPHNIPWLHFLSRIYLPIVNNGLIFPLWFCVPNINSSPKFSHGPIKLFPVKSKPSRNQKIPFCSVEGRPSGGPWSSSLLG